MCYNIRVRLSSLKLGKRISQMLAEITSTGGLRSNILSKEMGGQAIGQHGTNGETIFVCSESCENGHLLSDFVGLFFYFLFES